MANNPPQTKEYRFYGYPICPGIAIGKPFFYSVIDEFIPEFAVPESEIEKEVQRYYQALRKSRKDVISLQKRLRQEGGNDAAAILTSHLEMMGDPLMTIQVEAEIRAKGKNTEYVFKTVITEYEKRFSKIADQFFRERLKDVQDISRRIIGHLKRHKRCHLGSVTVPSIIFAHELTPSDTAEANIEMIEAFVTRSGAETSHVAIMARAMGKPFVSNLDFPDMSLSPPSLVVVNGSTGEVVINPNKKTTNQFREEKDKFKIQVKGLDKISISKAKTKDGFQTKLSANIEMFDELEAMHQYGGETVGLFRSEYLFLARDGFPSEEEQFQTYKSIVETVEGNSSVIRTFDIGGDKLGNFHPSRYEKNPNLGCRAIRLMLKEKSAFKTQIRAILRASAFGDVSILFPMISGVPELREAKAIVEEAKTELEMKGIPFARNIPIGCMIEIPSAAIICDLLTKECDFFSIGTNDLVQYSLAVDRGNPAMSYLYTPAHPSIIRMLKMVITAVKEARKTVSICGEIAGDPKFTALLLGLGFEELSVSPPAFPILKNVITRLTMTEAAELANYVLSLSTEIEIEETLLAHLADVLKREQ